MKTEETELTAQYFEQSSFLTIQKIDSLRLVSAKVKGIVHCAIQRRLSFLLASTIPCFLEPTGSHKALCIIQSFGAHLLVDHEILRRTSIDH